MILISLQFLKPANVHYLYDKNGAEHNLWIRGICWRNMPPSIYGLTADYRCDTSRWSARVTCALFVASVLSCVVRSACKALSSSVTKHIDSLLSLWVFWVVVLSKRSLILNLDRKWTILTPMLKSDKAAMILLSCLKTSCSWGWSQGQCQVPGHPSSFWEMVVFSSWMQGLPRF